MIYLLLSIAFSSLILVIFKWFERFNINTFQAIVVNYFVAFFVGFGFYGKDWNNSFLVQNEWMPFAVIIGFLFISLFLLMGKSAQVNGIGTTSVAVKMSLVIPVSAAIVLYNESLFLLKVIGIVLAIVSVFLITFQSKKDQSKKGTTPLLLFVLFIGSGLLDTLLNYTEKNLLADLSPAIFSAIGFGIAAVIGSVALFFSIFLKRTVFSFKSVLAGIVLGIPNYFSIYFLIMAIRAPQDDSITYAINNVGIVMASFVLGILFFKEKITWTKLLGGIMAVIAIVLLAV